MITLVV